MDGLSPLETGRSASEGDGVWTRHSTAGARQGQLPVPLTAQQRQMEGASQESGGGVWFGEEPEEAASVRCRPAGPKSRPYHTQGHARISPTWPV